MIGCATPRELTLIARPREPPSSSESPKRILLRLLERDLDHESLGREVMQVIAQHLDVTDVVWSTVDPSTLQASSMLIMHSDRLSAGPTYAITRQFFEFDVNHQAGMSIREISTLPRRVQTVNRVTGGAIANHPRFLETRLGQAGVHDEMRMVCVDRNQVWAILSVVHFDRVFTDDEIEICEALAPLIGRAARRSLLRVAAADGGVETPGLVLMNRAGVPVEISPSAREMLGARAGGIASEILARVDATGTKRTTTSLVGCGLKVAHVTEMEEHRALIIDEPGASTRLAYLVRAYGLTERERDVVMAAQGGDSTKHIADRLGISVYTTQEHLASSFRKVGVSNRQQLLARLMNPLG